jgi:hypothetical protein
MRRSPRDSNGDRVAGPTRLSTGRPHGPAGPAAWAAGTRERRAPRAGRPAAAGQPAAPDPGAQAGRAGRGAAAGSQAPGGAVLQQHARRCPQATGTQARRGLRSLCRPVPQRFDRVVAVGLPAACPSCGQRLVVERVACQYQEGLPLPRSSVTTRYELEIGRCVGCRRRIQPRHPEQTSDALGAAGVQVGPRAVALAVWASKGLGLPAAKVARLLGQLGLQVSAGGVTQALARAARRLRRPTRRWSAASRPARSSLQTRPAGEWTGAGRGCGRSPAKA